MVSAKQLSREEWKRYFDGLTKQFFRDLNPEIAHVELISRELGDQVVTARGRVIGLSYDPRNNVLEIALEGLDHLVYRPREITVGERDDGFAEWVEVTRDDGSREIIRLRSVGISPVGISPVG